jgi:hypothetical protein
MADKENVIHAHIFGRSHHGDREEVRMLLFNPDGTPFVPGSRSGGASSGGSGGSDLSKLYMPDGALGESVPRHAADISQQNIYQIPGYLQLAAVAVPAGERIRRLMLINGNQTVNQLTNQWAAIVRRSDGHVLSKGTDHLDDPWEQHEAQILGGLDYTPNEDELVWAGVCVAGAQMPMVGGLTNQSQGVINVPPILSAMGDADLTDPASLPATVTVNPTAVNSIPYYALLS